MNIKALSWLTLSTLLLLLKKVLYSQNKSLVVQIH